jgi:hypothetical protein
MLERQIRRNAVPVQSSLPVIDPPILQTWSRCGSARTSGLLLARDCGNSACSNTRLENEFPDTTRRPEAHA